MFGNSPFGFGFDVMSVIMPVFFVVVFALVIGVIAVAIFRSLKRNVQNNNSPTLSVDCRVVAKRTETGGGMNDTSHWTHYFATFEVESGDRMEFQLEGEQAGLLVEGDEGKVTFQGTRFVSFVRKPRPID